MNGGVGGVEGKRKMLADIGLVLSWILLVAQSQFVIGERIAFHSNLWTTELQRINPTVLPDLIVGMVFATYSYFSISDFEMDYLDCIPRGSL